MKFLNYALLFVLLLTGCDALQTGVSETQPADSPKTTTSTQEVPDLFSQPVSQEKTAEKARLQKLANELGAELNKMKSAQNESTTDSERLGRLNATERERYVRLKRAADALAPLERRLGKPKFGEWRSVWTEKRRSLLRYAAGLHMGVTKERTRLYLLPIGDFTPAQQKAIDQLPAFMTNFFCLPVKVLPTLPLTTIPAEKRRMYSKEKHIQYLAPYIIDHVIHPQLPDDAVGCLGIMNRDIYPGEAYGFMFGQSGIFSRSGLCSVYRFGNPGEGAEAERVFLTRLFKVAVHETTHMFSIRHEPDYLCLMNGRAILKEMDEKPLTCSGETMAKLCWGTGCNPLTRYIALRKFYLSIGFDAEAEYCARAFTLVQTAWRNHADMP